MLVGHGRTVSCIRTSIQHCVAQRLMKTENTLQITSITGSLTVHCVVQLRLQRQQKLPSRIQRRRRIVRAVGCGSALRPRPASKPARNGTQTTTAATQRSFFAAVCSFSCYQVADGARGIQLVTCRPASGRRVRRRRLMERRERSPRHATSRIHSERRSSNRSSRTIRLELAGRRHSTTTIVRGRHQRSAASESTTLLSPITLDRGHAGRH